MIFDKTGSLTQGKPSVVQELLATKLSSKNLWNKNFLYSLVSGSIHPVAVALKNHLEKGNPSISQIKLDSRKEILGKGLQATQIKKQGNKQEKKEIFRGQFKIYARKQGASKRGMAKFYQKNTEYCFFICSE